VRVRVNEIVADAIRNGRLPLVVDGRNVIVFAVKPRDVRDKAALLKQVAGPGQVIHPGLRHLSPSLLAREPLAEQAEADAGPLDRLVDRGMDDEAVKAVRHHAVCD
jgi:hypothetical protein